MPEHSNITFWVRSQEFDVDSTMCVFVPESLPPSEWVSRLPRYLERGAEEKPDDCPNCAR